MDAPWSNKKTLAIPDRLARLSQEILDFEKYIQPTKTEQLNRDTLLYSVSQLVSSLWPDSTVTAFGSSVTGLQFPASDVDINIDFDELPQNNVASVLKSIRRHTCANRIFQNRRTNLVAHAKVPVLMATDDNEVSMDITVQNECFSSDRTAAWIKQYPALKPLFMVLKQSIGNSRVTSFPTFEPLSAKTAGLASYSLICMIVSYLQLQVLDELKPTDPSYYAVLLTGFLDFYSKFESTKTAIGLTDGGTYYTEMDCPIDLQTKAGKLTILDPDVSEANVARSTLKFDLVQLVFKNTLATLRSRIDASGKSESILSSIVKVDPHYYGEPRKEGTRFKIKQNWIETGQPKAKSNKRGFDRRHRGGIVHQAGERNSYRNNYKEDSNYKNPYSRNHHEVDSPYSRSNNYENTQRYRQAPYSSYRQDNSMREYERHKRNNNTHLAQHYKHKAERSYSSNRREYY